MVQLSHPYMTTGKIIALTRRTFVGKVMSLLFNMLPGLVIAFLPKSKHLLISWLQSPSAVYLEHKKIKSLTVSIVFASICHEVMGLDAVILILQMFSFKPAFSLSSFTFSKSLFSASLLSAIRVVSSAYLRLLIFLLAILIPACASSSLAFHMVYSACKLNKQGNNNVTPWTATRQASLSITNSQSLLKLMSFELVMPSNHLILCPPLLLSSVFPSIRVFSTEPVLRVRWPKTWSFSFSISPSNQYSGLISFRMDWFDLAVQGTLKSLLQHQSSKASALRHSAFFIVQLSHPYMTTGKSAVLTRWTFEGKEVSLLFNMLSRFVRASLIAQLVKNPSGMQKTPFQFLGREDLLEKR